MENRRQMIDLGLQPVALGRPSQPRKGAVGEDLGSSQFTSGHSRGVVKSSRKPKKAEFSESDDELDSFSCKNRSSSQSRKMKDPKKNVRTPGKGKCIVASRPRPKAHQVTKATKDVDTDENTSALPSRPRPRPIFAGVNSFDFNGDIPPSNQLALESKRSRKASQEDGYASSPLEELSPNRAKRLKISKSQKKPNELAPFPMDVRSTVKAKKPSKPAPFPMEVPPKSLQSANLILEKSSPPRQQRRPTTRAAKPFPMESPSMSPRHNDSDDDDDLRMSDGDAIITFGGPRPFPMSISQYPVKTSDDTAISKRSARDDHHHEAGVESRYSPEPNDLGESSLDEHEDVDPSTICPYCDEPWPPSPSPTLIYLLERTKRKSYADPRHGNALGLKAPLTAFIELCQRHRFEMTHLPLAHARGWPTHIKFARLPKRIGGFRKQLKKLLDQPNESQFWREVRDDAKEVGTTKVVSLTGQYATFERTQPGYYGEQGSIIIHQSLYSLFPPDSISPTSVLPLTPDQFLTRVLVPETAVLLIQEDMGLSSKEEAMGVLDESKQYGVAMFPEQAQDERVAEVGEQLAKERAKARRKVLEERGEADADVRKEVEQEIRRAKRAKAKGKGKGKGTLTDKESDGGLVVSEKKKKGRSDDLSKAAGIEPAHRRWEGSKDVDMEDGSQEPTPRRVKVDKPLWGPSATSWRSNRSPSTSPVGPHVNARTSHKSIPAPPFSSQSPKHTGSANSQWSFRLRDDDRDCSPESTIRGDDEVVATFKYTKRVPETNGSDLDVVVLTDTETPKPRSKKVRHALGDIAKTAVSSDESKSAATPIVVVEKSRRPRQMKAVQDDSKGKASGALGQTKRKKKGKAVGASSSDGWLLSDATD